MFVVEATKNLWKYLKRNKKKLKTSRILKNRVNIRHQLTLLEQIIAASILIKVQLLVLDKA